MWSLEAKQASDWDHTAWIIAKIHNVNCEKPQQPRNPYRKEIERTYRFSEIKKERGLSRGG